MGGGELPMMGAVSSTSIALHRVGAVESPLRLARAETCERRSPDEGGLLGHDGAEHVQLRGPTGRPHPREHAG
jgi:hypothetical protein